MRITKKNNETTTTNQAETPKKRRTGRKIAIGVTAVVLPGGRSETAFDRVTQD